MNLPGPVSYAELPGLARQADVLVMPYRDLPVTRAMQPLKFKEYLATGLPVVTRDLPATGPWSAAADMVTSSTEFASRTMQRARSGIPEEQTIARKLLAYETWQKKAEELAKMIGIPDGYVSNKALPV